MGIQHSRPRNLGAPVPASPSDNAATGLRVTGGGFQLAGADLLDHRPSPAPATPDRAIDRTILTSFLEDAVSDAAETADALVRYFGSARLTLAATPSDLIRIAGMPVARRIVAARDLMLLSLRTELEDRPLISTSTALIQYLRFAQGFCGIEQFRLLHLDAQSRLIRDEVVARGQAERVDVEPRRIVELCLAACCYSVILVHNHPTGNPTPSDADRAFTNRLIRALHPIGIQVADHVIIARDNHFSLARATWL